MKPQYKLECDVWHEIKLKIEFYFMEIIFQKMKLKKFVNGLDDCKKKIRNELTTREYIEIVQYVYFKTERDQQLFEELYH